MVVQVVAAHVLDGKGKRVRIEAEPYQTVVNDVVILLKKGDLGEAQFTNLSGGHRARAVENQKNGHLQDSGDLFPTE